MATTGSDKIHLLTPGPTAVPDAVLAEIARPIIHHRTSQFREMFADLSQRLQRVFGTESPVLTLAGSGTTAFEAAQISLIAPGSGARALTIASGKFGERWQDIYETCRVEQTCLNVPWGAAPTAEQVAQALQQNQQFSVVTLVHSETSTATACDLQAIARAVREHGRDALLIVDGITSVAALPLHMDQWGVDVLVTGSQKALMLPPGLGFVALGPRAVHRLEQVEPAGYYSLDLRRWLKSWRDQDVPFTPPVNLIRGQRLALEMIESQGIESVWARTRELAELSRRRLQAMGLKLISESPSDSLTGAFYPPGVDDSAFRAALRDKHAIQIAGGQDGRGGQWKGRIFRISHMGYVDAEDTGAALNAIETELTAAGHTVG